MCIRSAANLPGRTHLDCHEAIARHVFGLAADAGFATVLTPRDIFASLVPLNMLLGTAGGKPGIIPDASIDLPFPKSETSREATARTRAHGARRKQARLAARRTGGLAGGCRERRREDERRWREEEQS